MKMLWIVIVGYCIVSIALYFIMRFKCKRNPVFKAPRSPTLYYILTFIWGQPIAIIGEITGLVMRMAGNVPHKYGFERCYVIKDISWGINLGRIIIVPENCREVIKMHEHGHGIQNAYLGIFTPMVVALPSMIRFWYREIREIIGKPCKTGYFDIWFEKSATASGRALVQKRRLSIQGEK